MSTQKSILTALRREPKSIAELCKLLNVTRNAIDVQIRQLESQGMIRASKIERLGKVGKPAVKYEMTPGKEDVFSSGYPIFLSALLNALKKQFDQKIISELLTQTGKEIAATVERDKQCSFKEKLRIALEVANSIGADTEATEHPNGTMVLNYSCPLASAVRTESCICQSLATFFAEITEKEVTPECLRDDRLICRYLINHE